jgi:hypothetical protein
MRLRYLVSCSSDAILIRVDCRNPPRSASLAQWLEWPLCRNWLSHGPQRLSFFATHKPSKTLLRLVVRLPGSASDQPGSYWAFSLKPMFGNCQLEYVTDLQKLSSDYAFQANHPMVGDPCSRAVFDPLEMADISKGAWARGAIVKGHAFRPPLAIEIQIQSDQLVAAKME